MRSNPVSYTHLKNSTKVYADISDSLLETIFFPNYPLHDGGVIIQGDRITCAGAVFKTSMNPGISKRLAGSCLHHSF